MEFIKSQKLSLCAKFAELASHPLCDVELLPMILNGADFDLAKRNFTEMFPIAAPVELNERNYYAYDYLAWNVRRVAGFGAKPNRTDGFEKTLLYNKFQDKTALAKYLLKIADRYEVTWLEYYLMYVNHGKKVLVDSNDDLLHMQCQIGPEPLTAASQNPAEHKTQESMSDESSESSESSEDDDDDDDIDNIDNYPLSLVRVYKTEIQYLQYDVFTNTFYWQIPLNGNVQPYDDLDYFMDYLFEDVQCSKPNFRIKLHTELRTNIHGKKKNLYQVLKAHLQANGSFKRMLDAYDNWKEQKVRRGFFD